MPVSVSSKVAYKDVGLKALIKKLEDVGAQSIRVGVVGPHASEPSSDGRLTLGDVAIINEYGSRNKNVPARSFVRTALVASAVRPILTAIGKQIFGFGSFDLGLERGGEKLADLVRTKIHEITTAGGNAAATIRKKGFDMPLFEFGRLVAAVSYQIVRVGGALLDAGAAIGDFESFEVT